MTAYITPKELKVGIDVLPDDNVPVWRYMSIPKFLALIHSNALYFHRADKFQDIYEGSFTQGSLENHFREWGEDDSYNLIHLSQRIPNHSYVSCWHASEHESAALWEIYGAKDGAIAIKSSIGTLKRLFPRITKHEGDTIVDQQIARVQYINYKTEHPYINDLAGPLCYKRNAFSYENEIRIIYMKLPTTPSKNDNNSNGRAIAIDEVSSATGINIPVDLNELIESVFIAPSSPGYLKSAISDIMKRFELSCGCQQSSLDDIPEYGPFGI